MEKQIIEEYKFYYRNLYRISTIIKLLKSVLTRIEKKDVLTTKKYLINACNDISMQINEDLRPIEVIIRINEDKLLNKMDSALNQSKDELLKLVRKIKKDEAMIISNPDILEDEKTLIDSQIDCLYCRYLLFKLEERLPFDEYQDAIEKGLLDTKTNLNNELAFSALMLINPENAGDINYFASRLNHYVEINNYYEGLLDSQDQIKKGNY